MERRTFLSNCCVVGGITCGITSVGAEQNIKSGEMPKETYDEAQRAIRKGDTAKAKDIYEDHGLYYSHSKKEITGPEYEAIGEEEDGATIEKAIKPTGTVDFSAWDNPYGDYEDQHIFSFFWDWNVISLANALYEGVAISWSESAYRPIAGTELYSSRLDNGGEWKVRQDVHQHEYEVGYPLVLDNQSPQARGYIAIDTQLRGDIERGTTLYAEYIHTWERIPPFIGNAEYSLPGPAMLTLDVNSWRVGDWKSDVEINYDPHQG